MMNKRRLLLTILFVILALASTSPVLAARDDPPPPDGGEVSGEVLSFELPGQFSADPGGQITPDGYLLPGGYAYAGSYLSWAALRMTGQAKTWLDNNVFGTYQLCAQVLYLKRNGVNLGGTGWGCASKTAGGSYSKSKIYLGLVSGFFWETSGAHEVSGNGYFWAPTTYVSKQL